MNKINPIKPSDIEDLKTKSFPDEVIDCFNKLIVKNFYKNESIVYQDDAVNEICKSMNIERSEVFSNGYLNIEDILGGKVGRWNMTSLIIVNVLNLHLENKHGK